MKRVQQEGSRFDLFKLWSLLATKSFAFSVWSLHVLLVYAWVLSGYPSKKMHVRLIGDSKLSLGESVSVDGCLSRLSLCGPVMEWRPVPRLSPNHSWNRLQSQCNPKLD